jgi:hypothetical protein
MTAHSLRGCHLMVLRRHQQTRTSSFGCFTLCLYALAESWATSTGHLVIISRHHGRNCHSSAGDDLAGAGARCFREIHQLQVSKPKSIHWRRSSFKPQHFPGIGCYSGTFLKKDNNYKLQEIRSDVSTEEHGVYRGMKVRNTNPSTHLTPVSNRKSLGPRNLQPHEI